MQMTKEQILEQVRALDPKERRELIEDLWQMPDDDELTPEQLAELDRRLAAVDRGEATFIPGDQVMRELRERPRPE
jgi:putative addiction module component (TIGR02574 family)